MANNRRTSAKLKKSRHSSGATKLGGARCQNTGINPVPGRRMHYHPYGRSTRNHWRSDTGGRNHGAQGFSHRHSGR